MPETRLFNAEDDGRAYALAGVAVEPSLAIEPPPGLDEDARSAFERDQRAQADDLRGVLRGVLHDPSILDTRDPYFWRMVVSTDQADTHGTRMGTSSLQNYAADADEGKAFLVGHNRQMLPVGYSLRGRFVAGQGGGLGKRTEVDFYTLRGEAETDVLVGRIQGSLLRDGSIAFGGRDMRWICSIDGADMLRSTWDECPHFPGLSYKRDGSRAKGSDRDDIVVCIATVEDAHMSETSGVYDGSTPGAGVVKAVRAYEAGLLDARQRTLVEQHYRIRLPDRPLLVPVGVPPPEEAMPQSRDPQGDPPAPPPQPETPPPVQAPAPEPESPQPVATDRSLAESVRTLGIEPGSDPLAAVRTELDRLRPLADAGTAYRNGLVERGLKAGIQAMGNAFKAEAWRASLTAAGSIASLEEMVENLEGMAEASLPNGRQTQGDSVPPAQIGSPRRVSMRASRA